MNDEQGARLNKMLRVIGYIISGVIVWFYTTTWILSFLSVPLNDDNIGAAYLSVGSFWLIIACLIINGYYHLYTWISTGEAQSIFDLIE